MATPILATKLYIPPPRPKIVVRPRLTERESEVPGLITNGLSNREVCERLFIAMNTTKGHNRNIYSKLEIERRTEAVAQARDLGLLQP